MNFNTLRNALTEQIERYNLFKKLEILQMQQTELLAKLTELTQLAAQNSADSKAKDEQIANLNTQVADLNAAINNEDLHPEIANQVAALEVAIKGTVA